METKHTFRKYVTNIIAVALMTVLAFAAAPVISGAVNGTSSDVYAAGSEPYATGMINTSGVALRQSAKASSTLVSGLNYGTQVRIHSIVFKSKKSTAKKTRWYYVTANGYKGYVNAAYVSGIRYKSVNGSATDELNYRKGPGTDYKVYSSVSYGTDLRLSLKAYGPGDKTLWYRTKIEGKIAYVCGDYVKITVPLKKPTAAQLAGKSALARSLLTNPTRGGSARYVAAFNESNCQGLFSINGHQGISTPQGLAYTGKKYYVLYGNYAGQRIVTYSSKGKRLDATNFAFAIGHPNGITWDPKTGLCYIFKGHQTRIYTWDPVTNKFGKSATPYNSSGGAYDKTTGQIYASSKPGMFVFTGDGDFRYISSFDRCNHGISHSAQDCGAYGGFMIHGVSGSNYRVTNFLDIYRTEDGAYLGSIKVALGEVESAVVGNDGYVRLLINHSGTTDAVWKTPLNVKELKF